MTSEPTRQPGYGEPAPAFAVDTTVRPDYPFVNLAGREVILVSVSGLGGTSGAARRAAIRSLIEGLNDAVGVVFFLSADPSDRADPALREAWIDGRVFLDDGRRAAVALGIEPQEGEAAFLYRFDRALRIVDRRATLRLDALVETLRDWVADWRPPEPSRALGPHPPALLLDKVFEPAFAAALIRHFIAEGGIASGFMVRDGDKTRGRLDARMKRRRDVFVADPTLVDQTRKRLMYRLVPAIEAAFQFRATRIERYLVARYDAADLGGFRPHRDNDTGGTAHRRFAVSINLNDEFEGGGLRFPEFGTDHYRPPPGSALAFSCSLLHEALPVTAGERYVFLTFLYGESDVETMRRNRSSVVDDGLGALALPQSGPPSGGGGARSA